MALARQDRDLIDALIEAAALKVFGKTKNYVDTKVEHHTDTCPNMRYGKGFLAGLVLCSTMFGVVSAFVAQWALNGTG